uniref:Disintegrin and metalloproteinase domain-containing protein 19-like n=1 Tax=Poecilia latipinna TaxID=48699 RepID=A0A3B3V785_9TELE
NHYSNRIQRKAELLVWTTKTLYHCSKRDLDNYFQKGGGMCLYNMPNMKDLVGGKKCGNGFVEDGEECDCGEPDECTNDCCNANNCTLREGAQCAHGVCCHACKLKQAGTMCRGPAGSCDLPEYCTGASPYCPANVYLLDGSSCQYGKAYCYNGMCLTHEQQCLQLWGYGAQPAHDACFEDVNAAGNAFGNCGKDEHGNYKKCEKSDAKCGKIQCHSAAKKPKGTNAVSIDTTIKTGGIEVKCRGTYVYSTQDGQGDLPDPGLVMTGTKCGEGKVCRDRKCQNASFTELESCLANCHGNGVCNSNGNCHCDRGWAPPFCEKPGLGGSVDSGPVQNNNQVGLVVGLLFAFLVVLPAVLLLFYCYRVKTSFYHKWISQREQNKKNKYCLPVMSSVCLSITVFLISLDTKHPRDLRFHKHFVSPNRLTDICQILNIGHRLKLQELLTTVLTTGLWPVIWPEARLMIIHQSAVV